MRNKTDPVPVPLSLSLSLVVNNTVESTRVLFGFPSAVVLVFVMVDSPGATPTQLANLTSCDGDCGGGGGAACLLLVASSIPNGVWVSDQASDGAGVRPSAN